MIGYAMQALKEFGHETPKQHHYGPSKIEGPGYGQKVQYVCLNTTGQWPTQSSKSSSKSLESSYSMHEP